MSRVPARSLLAIALFLWSASPAGAQSQGRCTRETLPVKGTPLTIGYCVGSESSATAGHDFSVHVGETYATARGSFSQQSVLQFIAGETASRVIEDVALAKVGLDGTLHLTLVYRAGLVHIESALLTPGAITVK